MDCCARRRVFAQRTFPAKRPAFDRDLSSLGRGDTHSEGIARAKLLLSADSSVGPNRSAADLTRLATTLGVDRRSVATMEGAKDTEEELDLVQRIVGEDRFILVTSASHMPRAVALFRARGLDPIPVPTGHAAGRKRWTTPDDFLPDIDGLAASSTAFYEYLGLAWAKVRGRIP